LVYDATLGPASAEQILGSAHVLAGGFFDHDWRLPVALKDPGGGTTAP
jgi:hypothetical protein